MTWELSSLVHLASKRISADDGERQQRTAAEILRRLDHQPGVILADEVGTGKTFVALAVAVSVVEATRRRRPVLVLLPPSVQDKWPKEWRVFQEMCMKQGRSPIRAAPQTVNSGTDLLRLLDDKGPGRNHIVFATHGAFDRSLTDPWVQLLLVRRAFLRRGALAAQRGSFIRWAGSIIPYPPFREPHLVEALLDSHPSRWRLITDRFRPGLLDDDPVSDLIVDPIRQLDPAPLVTALSDLPLRDSKYRENYLGDVRAAIRDVRDDLWRTALSKMKLRLPLLILDEAHHARNPYTRLARLLSDSTGERERGVLAGAFDRMLFLTATPFQLGHQELIRVLDRFDGIAWSSANQRADFERQRSELREALDRSQAAALLLQSVWGQIAHDDISAAPPEWWDASDRTVLPDRLQRALERVEETGSRFAESEALLRPWVIRHLKDDRGHRRSYRPGQQILGADRPAAGIEVAGAAVLPFLLAARAQGLVAAKRDLNSAVTRAFFAEGLSSSFEAYRETREGRGDFLDEDATGSESVLRPAEPAEIAWYLEQIDKALPARRGLQPTSHPKLAATVSVALERWEQRDKILIFCFYIATGRALRTHISRAVRRRTLELAADGLGLARSDSKEVKRQLKNLSDRFFSPDTALTRDTEAALADLVRSADLDSATCARVIAVAARFLRTPSFLARYVPLGEDQFAAAVLRALQPTEEEATLANRIQRFAEHVATRVEVERESLLRALEDLVTGIRPASDPYETGPRLSDDVWVPDVRLANGSTPRDARERLMLAFNSPFFPDVLVASAVMGEGVDLQLSCRHVVHHDGDWNPSIIEQRTGRVDRIASLAERLDLPVVVYEPYLAGAQDEKQYRVVKDRERWFNVVMGAPMELGEAATDLAVSRVEFPGALARRLAPDLSVASDVRNR